MLLNRGAAQGLEGCKPALCHERVIATQVDRLKTVREKAHFEAMFGARITFHQNTAILLL